MKQTPEVTIRLSEELLRKLIYVSGAEKRTVNNQFLFMIRNNIQYFEKTKGRIDPQKLRDIDISEYVSEENDAE
jgi:hypothetical protein